MALWRCLKLQPRAAAWLIFNLFLFDPKQWWTYFFLRSKMWRGKVQYICGNLLAFYDNRSIVRLKKINMHMLHCMLLNSSGNTYSMCKIVCMEHCTPRAWARNSVYLLHTYQRRTYFFIFALWVWKNVKPLSGLYRSKLTTNSLDTVTFCSAHCSLT